MYLSARVLQSVQNVNSYKESSQVRVRQSSPATVYVQLLDAEQTDSDQHCLRYMPAVNSTLTLTFSNLVTVNVVSKIATQPYSQDPSIWSVNLLSSETANLSSGNIIGLLTESGVQKNFIIKTAIIVDTNSLGFC